MYTLMVVLAAAAAALWMRKGARRAKAYRLGAAGMDRVSKWFERKAASTAKRPSASAVTVADLVPAALVPAVVAVDAAGTVAASPATCEVMRSWVGMYT